MVYLGETPSSCPSCAVMEFPPLLCPLAYCWAIWARTSFGRLNISSEVAEINAEDARLVLEPVVPDVSELIEFEPPPREEPELEPETLLLGREGFEVAAAIGAETLFAWLEAG